MRIRKGLTILAGFLALVIICLLTTIFISSKVSATTEPQLSYTTLVVDSVAGVHGDIFKFTDGNRECYFNSKGGVWCTP